jgi:hypothetical protein
MLKSTRLGRRAIAAAIAAAALGIPLAVTAPATAGVSTAAHTAHPATANVDTAAACPLESSASGPPDSGSSSSASGPPDSGSSSSASGPPDSGSSSSASGPATMPPSSTSTAGSVYQAEDLATNLHTATTAKNYSGSGYLAKWGSNRNGVVLPVKANPGTYRLSVRYAAAGPVFLGVALNGSQPSATLTLTETPDWNTWASAGTTVSLSDGLDTIALSYASPPGVSNPVNLDSITLAPDRCVSQTIPPQPNPSATGGTSSASGPPSSGASSSASLPAGPDDDPTSCPSGNQLTGAPDNNLFAGHNYNGHGTVLTHSVEVWSNTCVQGYTLAAGAQLLFSANPSNVTIVGNTFLGPDPGHLAMPAMLGDHLTIVYNTFRNCYALGYFYGDHYVFDHNLSEDSPEDGVHIHFVDDGKTAATNASVSWNLFVRPGSFSAELQNVVQNLRVIGNKGEGSDKSSGEYSIATGMHADHDVFSGLDTRNVEIANNQVFNNGGDPAPWTSGLEVYGAGAYVHDNYFWGVYNGIEWASTGNSGPNISWTIARNTFVGSAQFGAPEGKTPNFGRLVYPTWTQNTMPPKDATPPPPTWNYRVGASAAA